MTEVARPGNGRLSTKKKRVLQILHTDERGGIETLSGMITRGLQRHGIETDTIYLFTSPHLGTAAKLKCVARTALTLLRSNHDAIIAYQATASILTGVIGKLARCRRRIVHQTAIPMATAWPVRLADKVTGTLGLYTANIANTKFTRAEFNTYPDTYQRDMRVIVHGLDTLPAREDRLTTRARFALAADRKLILNVGRMVAQKNQRVLIEALASIPDAELVIAGHGPDEHMLRALAREHKVDRRIHLLGAVSPQDVADLLNACDVFAFPSTWETFGLAAVEAAIAKIPVVASDLSVLREVIEGHDGLARFIPAHDSSKWSKELNDILTQPPLSEKLERFSLELRSRYAVSKMVSEYIELLRQ